jgi:glycosyltransferase involved in cell wall biosynthesis
MSARPIKVMHVTTVPASLIFLRGQPSYMRQRGFDVSVVSSPGAELDAFGERERVPVHAVAMERRITPLRDIASVVRLWRLFRRERPDVVHAHTPKGGLLGTLAATAARVPVRIYHMRGLPLATQKGWRRFLLAQTERVSCALAHRVLCVGESLREAAVEAGISTRDRLTVLGAGSGQGVDTSRFDPSRFDAAARLARRRELAVPDDALVFGFVGRLVRDKGILELWEAWQQVREQIPHAVLIVVGGADSRDAAPPEMLDALARDERVRMVGFVSEPPATYAAMDVVVLPTYREGFPNVPLEAAAMCRPVVATAVTGCVDAVRDGETGTLVRARSGDDLARAMLRYASDPELRTEHGEAARRRVLRDFRRERVWQHLADEYARLFERPAILAPQARVS